MIVAGPPPKKLRNIILKKKIPCKGSSKIEPNHLPKKARISLNVCKLEDVSSTNTTKLLIMVIMTSRNAVACVVVQIFPWLKIFQTSLIFTFLCLKSITIIRDKEKQKSNWFEKF